jgi:integrase
MSQNANRRAMGRRRRESSDQRPEGVGTSARPRGLVGASAAANNLGQREFARVIKAAGVRLITLHGLRHISATLLLKALVPPQVVQQRLGHKRIEMTLGIYAHVLPPGLDRTRLLP